MATETHTPAPWGLASEMSHEVWIMAGHLHVASIPRAHDGDWSRANGKLVAAAPRLLDQHQAAVADLELLLKAITAGDPQNEIELRIRDLIRHERNVIAIASAS